MLRKWLPALTYERVKEAIHRGTLTVVRLGDTPILVVLSGRFSYSWRKGKTVKSAQIRLTRKFLNPRWIRYPRWYMRTIEELDRMSKDDLARIGVLRIKQGEYRVLVFQVVDDLTKLQRHLNYFIQNQESSSWQELVRLAKDDSFLNGIVKRLKNRVQTVSNLIKGLKAKREHLHGRIQKLVEFLEKSVDSEVNRQGIITSIKEIQNEMQVFLRYEPYAHKANLAQRRLAGAIAALRKRDSRQAIKLLKQAGRM